MEQIFKNVAETFPLFDTLGIYSQLNALATRPQGWFSTFNAAGQAIDWQFFNQRNIASAGQEYTNLETRDQVAWPFVVNSMAIHFFGPSATFERYTTQLNLAVWNGIFPALWEADVPRHMGVELWVNQDAKLRVNSMMPGSGGGPVVGGYGSLGTLPGGVAQTMPWTVQGGGQGNGHIKATYVFPKPIEIPVKAAISVKLIPSEYIRRLLQALPGPFTHEMPGDISGVQVPTFYGVRVTLTGTRFVQQRGEAHAR